VAETGLLEKPLPKPNRNLMGYAGVRTLEALLEALLALEFLGRGYTRNAAGKAFQAWKALLGALLAAEKEKLDQLITSKEQREWLERKGIPRVPTSRLKSLSQLLEDAGYRGIIQATSMALDLHDYQYHGPDPDLELSKYRSKREAAKDTLLLLQSIVELVEGRLRQRLVQAGVWAGEHDEALRRLRGRIDELRRSL